MRKITPAEVLSLNKILQMETNALASAKVSVNMIADKELKVLAESSITIGEQRIKEIQQFISENNVSVIGGAH